MTIISDLFSLHPHPLPHISMKYLFVSDIHGSLTALQKILHIFDTQQCDMLCLGGDLLNYGPRNGLPEGLDPMAIAEELNKRAWDRYNSEDHSNESYGVRREHGWYLPNDD